MGRWLIKDTARYALRRDTLGGHLVSLAGVWSKRSAFILKESPHFGRPGRINKSVGA